MRLENIKCVLFDMDGVLVDACDWHKQAFNEALSSVAGFKLTNEEHQNSFNGLPTKIKLQMLADDGRLCASLCEEISQIKQSITLEIVNSNCNIDNTKIEMINFLKNKKIVVCCFTNSVKKSANLILERAGILSLLDDLLTNQDVTNPKPHPEGYNKLIKKFNFLPEECLIIEDSEKGLRAAHDSGANVIKVDSAKEVTIDLFKEIE